MSDAIDYCKGCPTQVMCHTERRCMKPSDPMTEGAKTGLVRMSDEWILGGNASHQDIMNLRDTLTEALKVAGEALTEIKGHLYNPQDMSRCRSIATEALAALERIRTKGIPLKATTEHETEDLYPEGGFDFGGPEGEGW